MKKCSALILAMVICLSSFVIPVSAQAADTVKMQFYIQSSYELGGRSKINIDIPWDWNNFMQSATIYNNDLAIAAVVLANEAYDQNRVEYALEKLGFSNIKGKYNYPSTDWHRVAFSFAYNKQNNVVAIVLRGTPPMSTKDYSEWKSNISKGAKGFEEAFKRVKSEEKGNSLEDYLKEHNISNPTYFIVGHSRGGAVANLLGVSLIKDGINGLCTDKGNVFVYAFGAPGVTKDSDYDKYTNIWNRCNEGDSIPATPGGSFNRYGSTKLNKLNNDSVYTKFKELTGRDLKQVMEAPDKYMQVYILSEKQKYTHDTATYLAYHLTQSSLQPSAAQPEQPAIQQPQTPNPPQPKLTVESSVYGDFVVTIPSNTTVYGFSNTTSTSRLTLYTPKSQSFTLNCTRQLTMSDGTTRYFFHSGGSTAKDYYLAFTSSMRVENRTKVITTPIANGTVTIQYNANGGSGAPSYHTANKDSNGTVKFNLSSAQPNRSGYTFLGWRFENSTDYDIDNPGQSITFGTGSPTTNETFTYYAQWKINTSTSNAATPTVTFSNLSTNWDNSGFYLQFSYKANGYKVTDAYVTTQTDVGYRSSDDSGPWEKSDYLRIYIPADYFTVGKTYSWAATVEIDGQEIVSQIYSFTFKNP